MSSIENREYHIEDPLLPKLFLQSWNNLDKKTKGCVLITHGISEHSNCYKHIGEALANEGWFVYAWDLQGHGQSQGKRGFIKDFNDFITDLKSVINLIRKDDSKPTANFHLIGHSMGGLITLKALMDENPVKVKSVILSNPALSLAIKVPKVKEYASLWLNEVWPTLTLNNEINYKNLSRDENMMSTYTKDPLRHTKISPPLYLGMVQSMEWVTSHPSNLNTPLFMQISGQDKIINPQASLDFFKKIKEPKKIKVYEDSYHEVYNDINKQESIDDLIAHLGEYNP
jgi:alpha-beta hydrolase superfamily lysophospholipase